MLIVDRFDHHLFRIHVDHSGSVVVLQAPVFLGAQLHTLRARVYCFCLQMGRNVGAQSRLGNKNNYAKVKPRLTHFSILTTTQI
jgi:hypothetical protein